MPCRLRWMLNNWSLICIFSTTAALSIVHFKKDKYSGDPQFFHNFGIKSKCDTDAVPEYLKKQRSICGNNCTQCVV